MQCSVDKNTCWVPLQQTNNGDMPALLKKKKGEKREGFFPAGYLQWREERMWSSLKKEVTQQR